MPNCSDVNAPDLPPRTFIRARLPHEVEMGGEGFELTFERQDDLRALGAETTVGEYKLVALHRLPPAVLAEHTESEPPQVPEYDPNKVWAWTATNYPVEPKEHGR